MILSLSRTTPAGDRIIEPMVALAGCSKQHRIVVAGARGVELMLELQRRGYVRAAATANCGLPAGQYDVALVDWRRRTFKTLEVALDWLVDLLSASGVLVVWVDFKGRRERSPLGSRWNGAALSLRGEPSMTAAAPFRHGAEK